MAVPMTLRRSGSSRRTTSTRGSCSSRRTSSRGRSRPVIGSRAGPRAEDGAAPGACGRAGDRRPSAGTLGPVDGRRPPGATAGTLAAWRTGTSVVRWRSGLARTVRGTRSLQLGVGPEAGVLEGLTAPDWQLLALLERGPRAARPAARPRPRRPGAAPGGPASCSACSGRPAPWSSGPAPVRPGGGSARTCGRGRVRPAGAASLVGAEVAVVGRRRPRASPSPSPSPRPAPGPRRSSTTPPWARPTCCPGGASPADVGRRAAHVAAEAVHRLAPDVRTGCPADPDLVLLVSAQVPDAPSGVPLVQAGTTHLPVVVRPDHVVVGPLVVPGRGACLHCVDLHHSDLDPGWADAVRLLRRGSGRVAHAGQRDGRARRRPRRRARDRDGARAAGRGGGAGRPGRVHVVAALVAAPGVRVRGLAGPRAGPGVRPRRTGPLPHRGRAAGATMAA